jgi:hypothetical protein
MPRTTAGVGARRRRVQGEGVCERRDFRHRERTFPARERGKAARSAAGTYFSTTRAAGDVRASGDLGDQSSGGNATRQKAGRGEENSRPTSPLPPRTGPRNATWHSCSSSVRLCFISTLQPLVTRAVSKIRAPCALMARVSVSSSNLCPCASVPRIRIVTCISTRWLRRRAPGLPEVFDVLPMQPH